MKGKPTHKLDGIEVNADGLAAGLLEMMDTLPDAASYWGALSLGMLPAPLMGLMNKVLAERAAGFFPGEPERARRWVREVERAVSLAVLDAAKRRGILRV